MKVAVVSRESQLLSRYLELKNEIEALEKQLGFIKPTVTELLKEQPDKRAVVQINEHMEALFTLKSQTTHVFSKEVQMLEALTKQKKQFEIDNAIALVKSVSEFPAVYYRAIK